ncbi:hypothetical protein BDQ17DRAFT_1431436 [Cyathus striatus]|nr:hypothetical protein BDQ17DRAFT_1431436 [Cyathus striatus]
MSPTTSLRIAIVGAGPVGLTLARLLNFTRFHVQYTSSRFLKALRAAGLMGEFRAKMRVEGAQMRILDSRGKVLMDDSEHGPEDSQGGPPPEEDRPEIDRLVLREILLNSISPSTIKWGFKLTVESGYDLIIGADGAWSKVRPLVTDALPQYSGITCIEARQYDVDQKHPTLAKLVGNGSCFQFGDRTGRALMAQRNGDDSIRTYAMLRVPETWVSTCGINWEDDGAKEALIAKEYSEWAQELKNLVLQSDEPLIRRPLYMLPVGFKWESKLGVTLVGDSAHVMTPFAGVGVNVGMMDSLELFQAIKKHLDAPAEFSLKDALKEYETRLFSRSEIHAVETFANLETFFTKGYTAEEILQKMAEAMVRGPEES